MGVPHAVDLATNGTRHSSDAEPEAVLLHLAQQAVQRRAGYQPRTTQAITPRTPESRPMCSDRAIQFLALVVDGNVVYQWAAAEWFTTVALSGQRIHDAYLPRIIQIGTRYPHMRSHIGYVIGERARMLAHQIASDGDHAWVYVMQRPDVNRQLARQREHEQDILQIMGRKSLYDMVDTLPTNRFTWGEAFTHGLLRHLVVNYPTVKSSEAADPYNILSHAAFHCPLNCADDVAGAAAAIAEIIIRRNNRGDFPETHNHISKIFEDLQQKIHHIIGFRRKMVAAIENGE